MIKLILRKFLSLSLLAIIIISFFSLANIYTYTRLNSEKPIAQLRFTPIQPQEFDASIQLEDECEEKIYRLYGDQWRIDAEFLKWKSWATLFGVDAMYRIDRLSSRYENIEEENTKQHIAHDLKRNSTLNLNKLAERYNNKFPPIDTVYGSSAYEEMKANIVFTVFRTQSGILIREETAADSKNIVACKTKNAWWKNTILNADEKLAVFIKKLFT